MVFCEFGAKNGIECNCAVIDFESIDFNYSIFLSIDLNCEDYYRYGTQCSLCSA